MTIIQKTKRSIISEALAIISFIALTFLFKSAYGSTFNEAKFTADVAKIHGPLIEMDVKTEIKKHIIGYKNYETEIDEICDNSVGKSTLNLLITNLRGRKIVLKRGATDQFCWNDPDLHSITISPNYDEHGVSTIPLCGILSESSGIVKKTDVTRTDILFHELCHAYHFMSGKIQTTNAALNRLYGGKSARYLWWGSGISGQKDEELYNITGVNIYGFDPICCNMFDLYKSSKLCSIFIPRMFHTDWEMYQEEKRKSRFDFLNPMYNMGKFLAVLKKYKLR